MGEFEIIDYLGQERKNNNDDFFTARELALKINVNERGLRRQLLQLTNRDILEVKINFCPFRKEYRFNKEMLKNE
jgi:response regulator of citrate/malate metabolism